LKAIQAGMTWDKENRVCRSTTRSTSRRRHGAGFSLRTRGAHELQTEHVDPGRRADHNPAMNAPGRKFAKPLDEGSMPPWLNCPLFDPVRALLGRFDLDTPPDHQALNAFAGEFDPELNTASGHPIRFGPPQPSNDGYETRIAASGIVPTRPDDWHDFFNALAWCVWPRSKATLNALHLQAIAERERAGLAGRGRQRDALTQFDECGVLVVTSEPGIATALAGHEWHDVFWRQRTRLAGTTRFLVFGHASWDQLRAPFFGLCAKAIYRVVARDWFGLAASVQRAEADAWLAAEFRRRGEALDPRDYSPLPLMGIPGVTPESEREAYYLDTRQFRPRRR
jgi:hypothetical protein